MGGSDEIGEDAEGERLMDSKRERVIGLLTEMCTLSERILELPLEEEWADAELERLQAAQLRLRERLQADDIDPQLFKHPSVRERLRQCLQAEEQVYGKLAAYHRELGERIRRIRQGNRVRDHYQQVYTQAEGYFIDKLN